MPKHLAQRESRHEEGEASSSFVFFQSKKLMSELECTLGASVSRTRLYSVGSLSTGHCLPLVWVPVSQLRRALRAVYHPHAIVNSLKWANYASTRSASHQGELIPHNSPGPQHLITRNGVAEARSKKHIRWKMRVRCYARKAYSGSKPVCCPRYPSVISIANGYNGCDRKGGGGVAGWETAAL
jgi:hypothetical protein